MTSPNQELIQQVEELKAENEKLRQQLATFRNNDKYDLQEPQLSDLIDSSLIQNLMNQFYELTGYPIGIIDIKHNILVATGWQRICTDFYRVNTETCKLCHESDLHIMNHLQEGKFIEYKCKNGLWDIAQPIIIDGKHMATIFLGQFFYEDEEINIPFFEKQAEKYEFDRGDFIASLQQVPRFSREDIKNVMKYYGEFAQIISHQGYINLQLQNEVLKTKETKAKLRQTNNRLDSIINCIPSAIFVKDLDGSIVLCNDMFAEKVDMKKEDIINKTDFDIVPEEFALHNKEKDRELIHSDQKQIYTMKTKLMDGKEYSVLMHKSTFKDEKGEIVGIAGSAVDITELENIKQELIEAKEKAEHSDRLKSSFLANMSHEIRSPLNSIIGFADMLKRPNLPAEKKSKFIDIINKCGDQLLNLISDIIDISKIEANQIHIEEEEFDLNELIDNLYEMYKQTAQKQNLKFIRKKLSNIKDPVVITDRGKIRQIFTNLLVNSFKHTEEGQIEFGYELLNNQLNIFVKDSGIGIPKEDQEHIFERFYQVHRDNKISSGTGLGLSITKGFVDFMGGEINLQSEDGIGSEFRITLPLRNK